MQKPEDDSSVRSSWAEKDYDSPIKLEITPRPHNFLRKKRLKLGIKPQLIIIVAFSSIFSLLVLAIITGVYFNNQLTNMQATKLEVMAQLKVTQVEQSMQLLYNQVYWVSIRPPIVEALTSLRAGNTSDSVFLEAQSTLDLSIGTTELLNEARLYDLDLNVVASSLNNFTSLLRPVIDQLYPLNRNTTTPASLFSLTVTPFYTGPFTNFTSPGNFNSNIAPSNRSYFMGFTFPVFSNASVVSEVPTLAGFLSMIVNVTSVQKAVSSSDIDEESHSNFYMVSPRWSADLLSRNDYTLYKTLLDLELAGWRYVFSPFSASRDDVVADSSNFPNWLYAALSYPLTQSSATLLTKSSGNAVGVSGRGYDVDEKSDFGNKLVAAGYSYVSGLDNLNWHVIVEQPWSEFSGPVNKLKGIIAGVVIGTCIIACSITFGLAVLFVRPITRLQEATEGIAKFKKSQQSTDVKDGATSLLNNQIPGTDNLECDTPQNENTSQRDASNTNVRNSVVSGGSYGSGAYSSGLRLPGKIPPVSSFFKDELTELTDAFNIMTAELDQQYQYLEERVKMRTKELETSKIEAESANEAKTVFIANISHELRTPLNGILGMTAIAMEENDEVRIQDSLRLIYRSGELLLHILTELLTYSKNTLNRSKLEPTNFQILEVVYQVKSIFDKLALDQGVNFKINIKPNALRKLILHGDSNRIIQIVMNLVSNALKFTPVEGSVNVNFKLLGEYDEIRSGEAEFREVYVKDAPQDSISTNATNNINQQDSAKSFSMSSRQNPTINVTYSDDDNISVTTLSTNGYENHLFESQFEDRAASVENSPDATDKRSVHTTFGNMNEVISLPALPKTACSSSAADADTSSSNILSSPLRTHTQDQKQRCKLRKIYVPKTWVVRVEVSDTGPGIDAALQEKVFEPFIQGDQTLSRSYGGTGLGLSICRQLAAMMNGTLLLKSKVGEGSTFVFTVPLKQTAELVVSDSDFQIFCEDEFNPNSKTNRKVAFRNTPLASPMIVTQDLNDDNLPGTSEDYFAMCRSPAISRSSKSPRVERKTDTLRRQQSNSSFKMSAANFRLSKQSRAKGDGGNDSYKSAQAKAEHENGILNGSRLSEDKPVIEVNSLQSSRADGEGQESLKSASRTAELLPTSNIKILVAEDNKVNQEVIKRMLQLEHWSNITFACNGEEAFELFSRSFEKEEAFDIIFMDVQMPKLDGLACTKLIRTIDQGVPIIALTAFADESNVKECLSSGMSGFLSKPIRRKSLTKIMAQVCPKLSNSD